MIFNKNLDLKITRYTVQNFKFLYWQKISKFYLCRRKKHDELYSHSLSLNRLSLLIIVINLINNRLSLLIVYNLKSFPFADVRIMTSSTPRAMRRWKCSSPPCPTTPTSTLRSRSITRDWSVSGSSMKSSLFSMPWVLINFSKTPGTSQYWGV